MKKSWKRWIAISKKIVNIQATIILTIIYFLLIVPFAFFIKAFFKNVLLGSIPKKSKRTFWVKKINVSQDISWAREQ